MKFDMKYSFESIRILFLYLFCLLLLQLPVGVMAQKFEDYKAFSSGKGNITAVRYSPDGKTFASGNEYGTILIRDVNSNDILHHFNQHTGAINHLSYHPEGNYLISTSNDGTLLVWDIAKKSVAYSTKATKSVNQGNPYFTFAYFSVDGQAMVFGGMDGEMRVCRPLSSNTSAGTITVNADGFTASDYYYGDGNMLAVGTRQSVKIVDFYSKKTLKVLQTCQGWVQDVKYSADGTQIGCLCDDGNFTIWNWESGTKEKSWYATPPGPDTQVSFSPDGNYLVVGDTRNKPKVWDLKTGKELCTLEGHQGSVRCLDFHPKSKYILSGANDQMVKMWKWRQLFPDEQIPKPEPKPEVVVPTKETVKPVAPAPKPVTDVSVAQKKETPKRPLEEIDDSPVGKIESPLDTVTLNFNERGVPDSLGDRRVNTGKREIAYSDQIDLFLYDAEYEDGDKISINFNGEWVLKEYTLRRVKRKITLHLKPDSDNYLVVYAHNEGTRPPNTVAVSVFNGRFERKLGLSSDMKNSDAINFRLSK